MRTSPARGYPPRFPGWSSPVRFSTIDQGNAKPPPSLTPLLPIFDFETLASAEFPYSNLSNNLHILYIYTTCYIHPPRVSPLESQRTPTRRPPHVPCLIQAPSSNRHSAIWPLARKDQSRIYHDQLPARPQIRQHPSPLKSPSQTPGKTRQTHPATTSQPPSQTWQSAQKDRSIPLPRLSRRRRRTRGLAVQVLRPPLRGRRIRPGGLRSRLPWRGG